MTTGTDVLPSKSSQDQPDFDFEGGTSLFDFNNSNLFPDQDKFDRDPFDISVRIEAEEEDKEKEEEEPKLTQSWTNFGDDDFTAGFGEQATRPGLLDNIGKPDNDPVATPFEEAKTPDEPAKPSGFRRCQTDAGPSRARRHLKSTVSKEEEKEKKSPDVAPDEENADTEIPPVRGVSRQRTPRSERVAARGGDRGLSPAGNPLRRTATSGGERPRQRLGLGLKRTTSLSPGPAPRHRREPKDLSELEKEILESTSPAGHPLRQTATSGGEHGPGQRLGLKRSISLSPDASPRHRRDPKDLSRLGKDVAESSNNPQNRAATSSQSVASAPGEKCHIQKKGSSMAQSERHSTSWSRRTDHGDKLPHEKEHKEEDNQPLTKGSRRGVSPRPMGHRAASSRAAVSPRHRDDSTRIPKSSEQDDCSDSDEPEAPKKRCSKGREHSRRADKHGHGEHELKRRTSKEDRHSGGDRHSKPRRTENDQATKRVSSDAEFEKSGGDLSVDETMRKRSSHGKDETMRKRSSRGNDEIRKKRSGHGHGHGKSGSDRHLSSKPTSRSNHGERSRSPRRTGSDHAKKHVSSETELDDSEGDLLEDDTVKKRSSHSKGRSKRSTARAPSPARARESMSKSERRPARDASPTRHSDPMSKSERRSPSRHSSPSKARNSLSKSERPVSTRASSPETAEDFTITMKWERNTPSRSNSQKSSDEKTHRKGAKAIDHEMAQSKHDHPEGHKKADCGKSREEKVSGSPGRSLKFSRDHSKRSMSPTRGATSREVVSHKVSEEGEKAVRRTPGRTISLKSSRDRSHRSTSSRRLPSGSDHGVLTSSSMPRRGLLKAASSHKGRSLSPHRICRPPQRNISDKSDGTSDSTSTGMRRSPSGGDMKRSQSSGDMKRSSSGGHISRSQGRSVSPKRMARGHSRRDKGDRDAADDSPSRSLRRSPTREGPRRRNPADIQRNQIMRGLQVQAQLEDETEEDSNQFSAHFGDFEGQDGLDASTWHPGSNKNESKPNKSLSHHAGSAAGRAAMAFSNVLNSSISAAAVKVLDGLSGSSQHGASSEHDATKKDRKFRTSVFGGKSGKTIQGPTLLGERDDLSESSDEFA